MTTQPPRLAMWLLRRRVADAEPLIGDLLEMYAEHPSRLWFWRQVLAALRAAPRDRGGEIRPLRLLSQQPLDALDRTIAIHRSGGDTPSANPLPAGLGLLIVGGAVTALAPIMWWGLVVTFVAGFGLAAFLVVRHDPGSAHPPTRRLT